MNALGKALITGLRITAKSALILPLVAGMVWFNFTVDRSGLFQGDAFEREVALELLLGQNIANFEQMDERQINALYVQNLDSPLNTVVLGSSRVLQLNTTIAGTDSFYNLGMTGADFKDLLGTYYLFERADKLPKNIVIGLDPWLLNADETAIDYRSDKELYNEFLTTQLGIKTDYEPEDSTALWKAMISPSYFQGNLEYYFRDRQLEKKPEVVSGDLYDYSTEIKMFDGSVLYNASFRESSQEAIDTSARDSGATFLRMQNYYEPDAGLCELFDLFISHVQSKGVNVIFLMSPYHPITYSYVSERADVYSGFFKTEQWFTNYALENNIPLYGTYNPYISDCWYDDFYDGFHIKGEALSRVFPGIDTVLTEQQSGRAGSPWLFEEPLVSSEMAERIVLDINEITVPHVLIAGSDTVVEGEPCYVFERFASEKAGSTLLAKYAVSQVTGVFYRYDTSIGRWVHDTRFP